MLQFLVARANRKGGNCAEQIGGRGRVVELIGGETPEVLAARVMSAVKGARTSAPRPLHRAERMRDLNAVASGVRTPRVVAGMPNKKSLWRFSSLIAQCGSTIKGVNSLPGLPAGLPSAKADNGFALA